MKMYIRVGQKKMDYGDMASGKKNLRNRYCSNIKIVRTLQSAIRAEPFLTRICLMWSD